MRLCMLMVFALAMPGWKFWLLDTIFLLYCKLCMDENLRRQRRG